MTVGSLGYLGFRVKDVDGFSAFATNVLGLMPAEFSNGERRFRMDEHDWRLAIAEGDEDDIAFAGFEVAGPAELETMARRLEEAGVATQPGNRDLLAERGVLGLVTCQDPGGLPIEVFYGPTLRTEVPFRSPAGVPGFVTGEQGVGHAVISAKDVAAARHFYRDLLGFRLSDIIRMRMGPDTSFEMEFYHCNPRHHTLALIPLPMPKRLHHIMLQVPTLDAVGFAMERVEAAGAPITSTLGRHTNDRMVSFYTRTPAGFEVEYGFGALEVDDATWRVTRHDKPSSWGHKRAVPR